MADNPAKNSVTTMTSIHHQDYCQTITSELLAAQAQFHAVLDSLSDRDWRQRSCNPGWTNGDVLFHMALGFFLLPVLLPLIRLAGRLPQGATRPFAALLNQATGPFNWINGRAPRLGSRLFRRRSLATVYDWVIRRTLRIVCQLRPDEWQRGMWYPSRWDLLFRDYMTMDDLLRYPIVHMQFHIDQLAPSSNRSSA